jgi:transcription antitermination factor NusG
MLEDKRLTRHWYVLHTRSRHESVVCDGLVKKSLDVFLPKIKVRSTRRDRKAMIRIPLFPGYLFIRTDLHPHSHIEIVKTAGVVRLIGSRQGPVPVPDETIESLKIMVASELPIGTGSRLQQGDRVMVVQGPFAGPERSCATADRAACSSTSRPWASTPGSTWMRTISRSCRRSLHNCLTSYQV